MKKLFITAVLALFVVSCTKESSTVENTDMTADSAVAETSVAATDGAPFKKVEWSVEDAEKMLGDQKNDTLYVTNFFATWCGPCIRELPHFREKMAKLKDQPVKFTFVSIDERKDWESVVPKFAAEHGLSSHVVLLDGETLAPGFFATNFKQWDGGSIPFTFMRKGEKTDETIGMMSAESLDAKIKSFQ